MIKMNSNWYWKNNIEQFEDIGCWMPIPNLPINTEN